jgi:hypothetical protein
MKSNSRWQRFNDTFLGINYGVIGPLLGVVIYYFMQFSYQISFNEYLDFIARPTVLPKVISLAAIMNLLFFIFCQWTNAYKAARGIVFATIGWGVIVFYLKFFA